MLAVAGRRSPCKTSTKVKSKVSWLLPGSPGDTRQVARGRVTYRGLRITRESPAFRHGECQGTILQTPAQRVRGHLGAPSRQLLWGVGTVTSERPSFSRQHRDWRRQESSAQSRSVEFPGGSFRRFRRQRSG